MENFIYCALLKINFRTSWVNLRKKVTTFLKFVKTGNNWRTLNLNENY